MPPAIAVAAAATVVAGVGTVAQISAGKKQAKAQRAAMRYERQKNDLQSAIQKRDAVRAARGTYAQAQVTAENQGVAASSSAQGGQGSITSQLNSNLSFLDEYGFYSDQASKELGKANKAGANASMWGAVTDVAKSAYSMSGGFK